MTAELPPAGRADWFGQLAATDPYQRRARRLFERGQVTAVNGNQAELRVGTDANGNALELKEVPIISGYLPRVGDWVAIQYEAGHSGAPWVTGPSMSEEAASDPAGIGVFAVAASEPSDPQKSTIYFDEPRSAWRGWDGAAWVDLAGKLHNSLPDLQGGSASQYYHFNAAEHDGLQDFYDGSALASGYLKKLSFKAIDASVTSRTRLFEKNGDFFWAINAEYDAGGDHWDRIDTSKYAYLIGLYSKNGIPHEPGGLGGVAWWRATPGSNPIGDYTAVGGWELGFMMTQHRNYVMGGMNLELDGSGSPPYGRFTQIGSEDPSVVGGLTVVQRNAWYEGGNSWGRDVATKASAAAGFDANGDLFVWWYPDSAEGNAPWNTGAWQRRAIFHLSGDLRGRLDVIRSSSVTNSPNSAFLAKHVSSGDMAEGFASGYAFAIQDNAGVENVIAAIYGARAGADNTGKLSFQVASAGALAERMSLSAAGVLALGGVINVGSSGTIGAQDGDVHGKRLVTKQDVNSYLLLGRWGAAYPAGIINAMDTSGGANHPSFIDFQFASSGKAHLTSVGQFRVGDGSAGGPTYSFTSDYDTGVFRPAADCWAVVTAGSERVRVDDAGRVGMGVSAPKARLHGSGSTILGAANAAAADADLGAGQVNLWLDESNNRIYFKCKYSGGGVKSGYVGLA